MIFVDTSAFIAIVEGKDRFHKDASFWWRKNTGSELLTSNLIVIETLGWLRYKIGRDKTVIVGKTILYGGGLKIERITNADEDKAWKRFQKSKGRGISMVDCTSFVLMQRLKIENVFAFDQDFRNMGFKVLP